MIKPLPSIKNQIGIGALGFYEYRRCLKCPFGGLSESKILASGSLPEDVPNRRLIVGNIFHELMDYSKTGASKKEILLCADGLIKSNEKEYSRYIKDNKLGSLKSWSEITKAVKMSLGASTNAASIKENKPNNSLRSPDRKFIGVPDKYYITNNTGYIVEYKSARLYVEGVINPEYVEQVKFYSALLFQLHPNLTGIECVIKSLDSSSWKCMIPPEEAIQYQEEMQENYSNIRNSIEDRKTVYNEQYCIYCKKSVICEQYLQHCTDIVSDKDIYVISGEVSKKNNVQGSVLLEVGVHKIQFSLESEVLRDINIGKAYSFYNLKIRNKQLLWGQNSGIYRNG